MRVVQDEAARAEFAGILDEIVRDGARRMLAATLESEVDSYVAAARPERDDIGHALVTRNGKARARKVVTGAGALEIRAPRVNDQRSNEQGERVRFRSEILPPYARKSPKVTQVLPLLYLHGLSTGDFRPALTEFFGSDAGLSPAAITRLSSAWEAERKEFMARKLKDRDFVYIWVDGVHFNVRLGDDDRLCCLVIVGARLDGSKELIALADGYRESTESWAELLRACRKRGMRAPVVAVGDARSASGLRSETSSPRRARSVLGSTRPPTSSTRCRNRRTRPLGEPSSRSPTPRTKTQPSARCAPLPMTSAQSGLRPSPSVDDQDALLAFYDFPAEHWKHLRTTNPKLLCQAAAS